MRHRIGDDHAPAMALDVPQDIVVCSLFPKLDSVERRLERSGQLRVGVVNEGVVLPVRQPSPRRSPSAYASIGTPATRTPRAPREERQFVAMLVGSPDVVDHLSGLEHTPRLPERRSPACLPAEMLRAAQGRSSVLRANAVDLLASLRIDAEDRSRPTVRTGDEIPDAEIPDRHEAVRREHRAGQRLRRPRMNASGATSIVPRSMNAFSFSGPSCRTARRRAAACTGRPWRARRPAESRAASPPRRPAG